MREKFGELGGRSWFGCAHQGPLPLAAAAAAREAVAWKVDPRELTSERFSGVPARLKRALGKLVGVPGDDIILANGASFGLHLLANGVPLEAGDEIIVMQGDFPSNILPWLAHRERGVGVRVVRPRNHVLDADEIAAAMTARTRVVCMSWVHSFSGHTSDLEAIGSLCRERGAWFIANVTQGVGARPLDLSSLPVDAAVCSGWKWLCGPYATGFAWFRKPLLEQLRVNHAYWLSMMSALDLSSDLGELELPSPRQPHHFDIFGTADFLDNVPWTACVEMFDELGIDAVHAHDQSLVDRLLAGVDRERFELVSPEQGARRSAIVALRPFREPLPEAFERLRAGGVDVSMRLGNLRFAVHVCNTADDVDRAIAVL